MSSIVRAVSVALVAASMGSLVACTVPGGTAPVSTASVPAINTAPGSPAARTVSTDDARPGLLYASYLGGQGSDGGQVLLRPDGRLEFVAITTGGDSIAPGVRHVRVGVGGGEDLAVVWLDARRRPESVLTIGGSGDDEVWSAVVGGHGETYLAGFTTSKDLPTTPGAAQRRFGGGDSDAFLIKVTPDGSQVVYSTYVGGAGSEESRESVGVDRTGSAYLSGSTASRNFPVTRGALQTKWTGGDGALDPSTVKKDAFLTRLSADGRRFVFSTLIGGRGDETVRGPAFDSLGNLYLVGATTSTDFPVTAQAFQNTSSGGYADGWAMKLDSRGQLIWSTYLGSTDFDALHGVATGSSGDPYVVGASCGGLLASTAGAAQPRSGGGCDDVVARLRSSDGRPVYLTFLGGPGEENEDQKVAVLHDGRAVVMTTANEPGFPVTTNAIKSSLDPPVDFTFSVISADGSHLDYSTYLGGTGEEDNWGARPVVAPDGSSVYVSGVTWSADLPTTVDAAQPTAPGGDGDGFIVEVSLPK